MEQEDEILPKGLLGMAKWMSVEESAAYLGISVSNLVFSGSIRADSWAQDREKLAFRQLRIRFVGAGQ